MRNINIKLISILLTLVSGTTAAFAKDNLTAKKIITRSRLAFYYSGNDMKARVLMTLINKQGRKRIRELTMLRKDFREGGDQRYFIYFHKPADVKNTTFLVYKFSNKPDNRWLFIPVIKMVKRIAANDKYSSFVGSDFTYEDISGRKPEEDRHSILREEEFKGKNCYVIRSIPKTTSTYTKRISWIDKKNFLPIKEEFYDKQEELYRKFESIKIKNINGYPTITERVMKNVKTGHSTNVVFSRIKYNSGLTKNLFSERYLRRPPLKWIR